MRKTRRAGADISSIRPGSKVVREQAMAYLFLAPVLILLLLTKYIPIVMGLFISFFDIDIVNLPGDFVAFDNYLRAFKDPYFYKAMWHNVKFLLYGLCLTFWPPIIVAMFINEQTRGKTFFRLMYYLPAVASGIAVTVIWKYFWQPDFGLANYLLSLIGQEPKMWLNDPSLVYLCFKLPGLLICGGMNMLTYLAAMQNVDPALYEAAIMEGAGFWTRVRKITIPNIKGVVGILFLFELMNAFNMMDLVMTNGGPVRTTETMILYAYNQAMNYNDYSYAIAMANIVFFIILILTAVKTKYEKNDD